MKRHRIAKLKGPLKGLLMAYYPMSRYVVDATESLKLRLTTPDVQKAEPKSLTNCPNARCIKRCLPGRAALVGRSIALVVEGTLVTRYIVPRRGAARKIIENADLNGRGVVGQRFTLAAPSGRKRLGYSHKHKNTGTGTKHRPQVAKPIAIKNGTLVPFASGLRTY